MGEWKNKMSYVHIVEHYLAIQMEWIIDGFYNVYETIENMLNKRRFKIFINCMISFA